ncbi:MAG: hypothetical protein ISS52_08490 [Dehalococcoidia bacterium]|nr:hypothetical protein [Dehalococcoidia bacterium]
MAFINQKGSVEGTPRCRIGVILFRFGWVYSLDIPRLARWSAGSVVEGVPGEREGCGLGWEVLGTNQV